MSISGARPEERHGPYCNALRQTLNLAPGGFLTNCFMVFDDSDPGRDLQTMGRYDEKAGRIALDHPKIASLKRRAAHLGSKCRQCFASFHCARSCPDRCALDPLAGDGEDSFRCRLNKALARLILWDSAYELLKEEMAPPASIEAGGSSPDPGGAAALAELEGPWAQAALEPHEASKDYDLRGRRLPPPVWEAKGFELGGEETWEMLSGIIASASPRPMSIYVHVPFCASRCGFCDCYAFKTKAAHPWHERYARRLRFDLSKWSELPRLASWPVTTVHFGGGTPSHLGPRLLAGIVEAVRAGFNTGPETEWAVEATAVSLEEELLELLWRLGARRLHVGVQTLEEPLRRQIGRQESAQAVLRRLEGALAKGFVTTADLLYGLPGQSAKGFLGGIEALDSLGIDGLSLYRFNRSPRNGAYLRRHPLQPDAVRDFAMFAAADKSLSEAGYEKSHFCHYAGPRDKNLYFTHGRRGEDLLAAGASADGIFGDLNYRCQLLSKKFADMDIGHPVFQGSAREIYNDKSIKLVSKYLITGSVPAGFLSGGKFKNLVDKWKENKLIAYKNSSKDEFVLTASGSWHVSTMLDELRSLDYAD